MSDTRYMDTIGKRLKAEREALKMKQPEFARLIGLTQSFLWDLEKDNKTMSADKFMGVCDALGITAEYLYYGKGVREMDERSRLEQELLTVFRKASAEDQRKIIGSVRGYVGDIPQANEEAA